MMSDFMFGVIIWLAIGVVTLAIIFLNHRHLKKKRIIDERYERIHQMGRSYAWVTSAAIIFIVWFISLVVFESKLAFFLITAIWVGHNISYIIGAAIAQSKN
ncbi:hypothetical protein [Bacillus sp. REN10]|uniref:hypothetical protein n=1 Tax=Bacillus sp. REN10 TaxID=2782541 RepID=UPI00193BE8D7|nr:hypothetical protein [Bacillus sp. REN10]